MVLRVVLLVVQIASRMGETGTGSFAVFPGMVVYVVSNDEEVKGCIRQLQSATHSLDLKLFGQVLSTTYLPTRYGTSIQHNSCSDLWLKYDGTVQDTGLL